MRSRGRHRDAGAAIVDFVLVVVLLVPLLLGVLQLGLVLHVRNTLVAAASEGARYGAALRSAPADGAVRTQQVIDGVLADRFAEDISAQSTTVDGYPGVVVQVRARVPPLGLWGPEVDLLVRGHATAEVPP